MKGSQLTASLFKVTYTPNNSSLAFNIVGVSSIKGNVEGVAQLFAYGFKVGEFELNPCKMELMGMCPMNEGQIEMKSNLPLGEDVNKNIPGVLLQGNIRPPTNSLRYCLLDPRLGRLCSHLY